MLSLPEQLELGPLQLLFPTPMFFCGRGDVAAAGMVLLSRMLVLAVSASVVAVVVVIVGVGVVLDVGDVGRGVKGGSDAGNIAIGIDVGVHVGVGDDGFWWWRW